MSVKNQISLVSTRTYRPETIDGLKEIARDHWARFRPKMFQRLTQTGMLEDLLDKAVQFTREDMNQLQRELMEDGYTEAKAKQTAWENLQQKWILLPKEK